MSASSERHSALDRVSKYRLVVFDLDGTLVDSRKDIADSANETLVSFGADPLTESAIGRMVGNGAPILVARAFAAAGLKCPSDALDRFLVIYHGRLLNHTRAYPGIRHVLERLAGRCALAVLTNKPLDATRTILAGVDLLPFFPPSAILGGDGLFPRKPSPDGLRHLMAAAGVAAGETLLVGDSAVDRQTARNAATDACLVRYGFGWEESSVGELESSEWTVDTPLEIIEGL
jgi:phosphoglycolate phosphatase